MSWWEVRGEEEKGGVGEGEKIKSIQLLNRNKNLFGKQCSFVQYLLNPMNTQCKIQCSAKNKNKTEDSFGVWQMERIMKLYPTR